MSETPSPAQSAVQKATSAPLWTCPDVLAACNGTLDGDEAAAISSLSIDTRTLEPGALFVALKDVRDGHDFVANAFAQGAAAALVSETYVRKPDDGPLIRVPDTLAALEMIGRAARARIDRSARAIAVTGSVGKTGTKEMLRACFAALGPTHAAERSFNNHLGVPLTLAHMPPETQFGIFEIGMNHAGEITPLTAIVRPHVAIVTTVEAVHIENFANVEGIADAKAEIFSGLGPGGIAVINFDNPHYLRLAKAAEAHGAQVLSFGTRDGARVKATRIEATSMGSEVDVAIDGVTYTYRLGIAGVHIVMNSLSVAAALAAFGVSIADGLAPLADLRAPPGRGARSELEIAGGKALLIDESYNANPASMRAALEVVASLPRDMYGRRIAVLGDMLELGTETLNGHKGLASAVEQAGVDVLYTVGPNMAHLHEAVGDSCTSDWRATAAELQDDLLNALQPGDVVMVKGSNGSRTGPLAEAIRTRFCAPDETRE